MWLNQLTIAIVQKDMKLLDTLLEDIPKLDNPKEVESAICLLGEAKSLMESLKSETSSSMMQVRKNIDFLNSTVSKKTSKFDITL